MTSTTTDRTYNGWANYETWAVKLWIDNEEHTYNAWRNQTQNVWRQSGNFPEPQVLSRSAHARGILADALKEWAEASAPDLGASLWADLLNAALGEVDWFEIADNMLSDIDGYEAKVS